MSVIYSSGSAWLYTDDCGISILIFSLLPFSSNEMIEIIGLKTWISLSSSTISESRNLTPKEALSFNVSMKSIILESSFK